MKFFMLLGGLAVLAGLGTGCQMLSSGSVSAEEVSESVASGEAVIVDVREPVEWQVGVVEGAALLPLSDLRGERIKWTNFLKEVSGKKLLLYCRSGNRSGLAKSILESEGYMVSNIGGFSGLKNAGLPTSRP